MTETANESAPLLLERDGGVATVMINDAPRNRLGLEFMDELEKRIGELASDKSVRAIVLRGAGEENFSVGMNLKHLPAGVEKMGSIEAVFDQRLRVLASIEGMEKPWIAVMCGYCLGRWSGAAIGLPLPPRRG